MAKSKGKARKALAIVGNIALYLFLGLCLAAVICATVAKRSDDGAVSLFGHEMRIVLSPSMQKSDMTDVSGFKIKDIPVKSLVVTENVPEENAEAWYGTLAVGDVLTFRYRVGLRQETVTHRIIAIEENEEAGYTITLRGDNRTENEGEQIINTADKSGLDYVLGKVVFVSPLLGNIIYILQQPVGIALVIIVPAAIIIIFQIVRIVNVLNAEKRKKTESSQAEEIEELRRKLAEIEQRQTENGTPMPDPPAEVAPEPSPPNVQNKP